MNNIDDARVAINDKIDIIQTLSNTIYDRITDGDNGLFWRFDVLDTDLDTKIVTSRNNIVTLISNDQIPLNDIIEDTKT